MRTVKLTAALLFGIFTVLALGANVSAAGTAEGITAVSMDSVSKMEIFTKQYGFAVNFEGPGYSSSLYSVPSRLLERVSSVEIMRLKKSGSKYIQASDSVTFNAADRWPRYMDTAVAEGERNMFYEPAAQIRAKLAEMNWTDKIPGDIGSNHIRLSYNESAAVPSVNSYPSGGTVILDGVSFVKHIYSGELTDSEVNWFKMKVMETLGLPGNYSAAAVLSGGGLPEPSLGGGSSAYGKVKSEEPDYFYFDYTDGGTDGGGWYSVNGSGSFLVWTENGKTYAYLNGSDGFGGNRPGITVFAEADGGMFESLAEIIAKNKVKEWNGTYSRTNSKEVDYFSFESVYGGDIVQAYMYGDMPENYKTFQNDIFDFFAEFSKTAAVYVPPREAINNISMLAGGFSVNFHGHYGEGNVEITDISVSAYDAPRKEAQFYSDTYRILNDYFVEENVFYDFDFNEEAFEPFLERMLSLDYINSSEFFDGTRTEMPAHISVNFAVTDFDMGYSVKAKLTPQQEAWFVNRLAETLNFKDKNGLTQLLE